MSLATALNNTFPPGHSSILLIGASLRGPVGIPLTGTRMEIEDLFGTSYQEVFTISEGDVTLELKYAPENLTVSFLDPVTKLFVLDIIHGISISGTTVTFTAFKRPDLGNSVTALFTYNLAPQRFMLPAMMQAFPTETVTVIKVNGVHAQADLTSGTGTLSFYATSAGEYYNTITVTVTDTYLELACPDWISAVPIRVLLANYNSLSSLAADLTQLASYANIPVSVVTDEGYLPISFSPAVTPFTGGLDGLQADGTIDETVWYEQTSTILPNIDLSMYAALYYPLLKEEQLG